MKLNWIILISAGIFEVLFAFCLGRLRTASGTCFYFWIAGFLLSMSLSLILLFQAVKILPLGTSYAVWTGIGTAGSVFLGILLFKEPVTVGRIFFLTLLIISIIGLNQF